MKFKSKVHIINIIAHLGIIGLCSWVIIICYKSAIGSGSFISMILPLIITFFLVLILVNTLTPLFKTYYLLQEEKLEIKWGRNEELIPYKNIMTIEKSHNWFTTNCLSIDKLKIGYITRNGEKKTIYVSPSKKEEFIKELKTRCHSMKIVK